MKKILISLIAVLVCISASAQIVTSTTKLKTKTRTYNGVSGWQVAVDGMCVIGPSWYLCAGAEVSSGYRYPSGLYLGGQVGGGWGEMSHMTYTTEWGWHHVFFEGGYVPFRFDTRYYFSSRRVQPYVQCATGMVFIFGGGIAAYNLQLGPGLSVGITDALSAQLAVNADMAVPFSNTSVKLSPTVKAGITYHFGL